MLGSDGRLAVRRLLVIGLLSLAAVLSGGCASTAPQDSGATPEFGGHADGAPAGDIDPTVVAYRDYRDPLINVNRAIFAFNDVSYRYILIPLGKGYINRVPGSVRQSVGNFFYNIKAPIYLVNNTLQLKPRAAGTNLLRFGINTTIGLLGLFDPATHWFEIDKAPSSFEDTLARYGAGYGFYLVLPFLGSSDLRNGTSALTEGVLHPISYLADDSERIIIQSFDYFQAFAPEAERYEDLVKESEDPYIFIRNLYLQGVQRDADSQNDQSEQE
ncbi:MAG: VacJ family lipoprotein [Cellvibrionaceae bacterium]